MEPEPGNGVFGRLDAWLRANAPATAAAARPPANLDHLREAERAFGRTLLPSVRALFRWHDGGGSVGNPFWLAPDFGMLSIQDAVDEWNANNIVAAEGDGPIDDDDNDWDWNRAWLPVATSWTGDFLVVDHRPSSPGRVLTFNHDGPMMDEPEFPSVEALLEELYNGLTTNVGAGGRDFDVADGALQWQ